MTALVQHSLKPALAGDELQLIDCARADLEFARRRSRIPIFGRFVKEREQRFCIRDVNTKLPEELDQSDYQDIAESAIHLPATTQSIRKIKRVFETLTEDCVINDVRIRYCDNNIDAIFYSIVTHVKPRKR